MHAVTARQLLAVDASDATALSTRCKQPITPASQKYCAALFRTLERCWRSFGRFTLRCTGRGATACSTSLAQIQGGRCGAPCPAIDDGQDGCVEGCAGPAAHFLALRCNAR